MYFLDSSMLHVLQNEVDVMYPSERINVGGLDLLSNELLRHGVGKERIQTLAFCWGLGLLLFFIFIFLIAQLFSFSANPAYHELLLTVLWYGVVHTSALVRCTAARMFEVSGIQTF